MYQFATEAVAGALPFDSPETSPLDGAAARTGRRVAGPGGAPACQANLALRVSGASVAMAALMRARSFHAFDAMATFDTRAAPEPRLLVDHEHEHDLGFEIDGAASAFAALSSGEGGAHLDDAGGLCAEIHDGMGGQTA